MLPSSVLCSTEAWERMRHRTTSWEVRAAFLKDEVKKKTETWDKNGIFNQNRRQLLVKINIWSRFDKSVPMFCNVLNLRGHKCHSLLPIFCLNLSLNWCPFPQLPQLPGLPPRRGNLHPCYVRLTNATRRNLPCSSPPNGEIPKQKPPKVFARFSPGEKKRLVAVAVTGVLIRKFSISWFLNCSS